MTAKTLGLAAALLTASALPLLAQDGSIFSSDLDHPLWY